MLMVANGWDGVWASLAGGLVSGVTVVVGVYLAQHLRDIRQRIAAERAAADGLLIEVANARDASVYSRSKSRTGTYDLWPLRHQLYLSHALHSHPTLQATQNFYDAVWALREWVRLGPLGQGSRTAGQPAVTQAFDDYRLALDRWGDELVAALKQYPRTPTELALRGPTLPLLP